MKCPGTNSSKVGGCPFRRDDAGTHNRPRSSQKAVWNVLLVAMVVMCTWSGAQVNAQYRDYTDKYREVYKESEDAVVEAFYTANAELNTYFNPERSLLYNNEYKFDYPKPEDYKIGIIVDPCRGAKYDCCINVFGVPEYGSLKVTGHLQERVVAYPVVGNETEVQSNYVLSYEDAAPISSFAQRTPDDEEVHDYECEGNGVPYGYCAGKNYAFRKAAVYPACMDYNQSMNALSTCITADGEEQPNCVAVAYAQSAFIAFCNGGDPHCGTYLEVHQIEGTPYSEETDVIAERVVAETRVSGYFTTTLPLTWMGNPKKVLCAYSESFIRVGSIVYVTNRVPTCCCAKPYKPATRVGSVQCPTGPTGSGALGKKTTSLAETLTVDTLFQQYPYCPINLDSDYDSIICSVYDVINMRHYAKQCDVVTQVNANSARSWTSDDLDGKTYDGLCPYFDSCALTLDNGLCFGDDLVYSFAGRVGRVTEVDDVSLIPKVRVSFNDGRTSYLFNKDQVEKEYKLSMYEIWWTLRTKSELIVQKRKGFNVTEPKCTFDIVNNRYFPYTLLDDDGNPLDSATLQD